MTGKRIHLTFLSLFIVSLLFADIPVGYYTNASGKSGAELKTSLYQILKEHKRIPYGSAYGSTWTVFRKSDVYPSGITGHPEGSIWDMYSDIVRYFPSGQSGSNREMNIEHSAPKSWWGDSQSPFKKDASYDLHHLVPSDASANSAKSNYPLGEITGSVSFSNGVSTVGIATIGVTTTRAFEPADEYKGDFARMSLYLVTCYQDYTWSVTSMFASNTYPTLTDYGKSLLLKWHRQDPVSQKEKNRNEAVYSFQYNRNPFIDYPDLVEYIWGDHYGEIFYFGAGISTPIDGELYVAPVAYLGQSRELPLMVKGGLISSAVDVSIEGNSCFKLPTTSLSSDEVNRGVRYVVTYAPSSIGIHSALLTFSGSNFNKVTIPVKGVCAPASIERIYPVGLKSVYSVSDSSVSLLLNVVDAGVTWSGDGVSGNTFSPSEAGKGTHVIRWKSASNSGNIRIIVK